MPKPWKGGEPGVVCCVSDEPGADAGGCDRMEAGDCMISGPGLPVGLQAGVVAHCAGVSCRGGVVLRGASVSLDLAGSLRVGEVGDRVGGIVGIESTGGRFLY